jgi:hypothetical protein
VQPARWRNLPVQPVEAFLADRRCPADRAETATSPAPKLTLSNCRCTINPTLQRQTLTLHCHPHVTTRKVRGCNNRLFRIVRRGGMNQCAHHDSSVSSWRSECADLSGLALLMRTSREYWTAGGSATEAKEQARSGARWEIVDEMPHRKRIRRCWYGTEPQKRRTKKTQHTDNFRQHNP